MPPYLHWNQAPPKAQQVSEKDISRKFSSKNRNIALSSSIQAAQSHTKPTDTSKLITGHFIALQREEIQLHPPEHLDKIP